VSGFSDGDIVLNPLFMFEEEGEENNKVIGFLKSTGNKLEHTLKLRMAGISLGD